MCGVELPVLPEPPRPGPTPSRFKDITGEGNQLAKEPTNIDGK